MSDVLERLGAHELALWLMTKKHANLSVKFDVAGPNSENSAGDFASGRKNRFSICHRRFLPAIIEEFVATGASSTAEGPPFLDSKTHIGKRDAKISKYTSSRRYFPPNLLPT